MRCKSKLLAAMMATCLSSRCEIKGWGQPCCLHLRKAASGFLTVLLTFLACKPQALKKAK